MLRNFSFLIGVCVVLWAIVFASASGLFGQRMPRSWTDEEARRIIAEWNAEEPDVPWHINKTWNLRDFYRKQRAEVAAVARALTQSYLKDLYLERVMQIIAQHLLATYGGLSD